MNKAAQHRNWILEILTRLADTAPALAILLVLAVLATGSAQAQPYTEGVLYSFTGGTDGARPAAGLVRDAEGNLYGTASVGGDLSCLVSSLPGCGVVFKVDTSGNQTVLYAFTGTGGDGQYPNGSLVLDAQGNLYGTTAAGGNLAYDCGEGYGCGTVFKLDTAGNETVLYSFTGAGGDGASPYAGLVLDAQGNLYGTNVNGGDLTCNAGYGCGTVFKVDTTGKETVLHAFTGTGGDGAYPWGGLVRDAQGNLYGATQNGGDLACDEGYGCGTVFKLDTTGKETVLYAFTWTGGDGAIPWSAGLVRDAKGNLYGTTSLGGASGQGTVFKVGKTGKETVLYSFTGGTDGGIPWQDLVQDAKGNLYGATIAGGDLSCVAGPDYSGCGTAFKLDATTGKETVLYTFTGAGDGDGAIPTGVVRDAQGNLYGTTHAGGDAACYAPYGCGTVFKLTPSTVTKTTTTLTSSPNPSTYGEAVTFTATVAPAPPDGETVSFMKGKTVLGTGTLSSGSATFTTSTLKVGTTAVTAVYAGDSNFAGSKSKAVKQVVEKAGE
jgi:uncharacterized repeat protein (TIGR03803 family)